jgi:hypothetical protein
MLMLPPLSQVRSSRSWLEPMSFGENFDWSCSCDRIRRSSQKIWVCGRENFIVICSGSEFFATEIRTITKERCLSFLTFHSSSPSPASRLRIEASISSLFPLCDMILESMKKYFDFSYCYGKIQHFKWWLLPNSSFQVDIFRIFVEGRGDF